MVFELRCCMRRLFCVFVLFGCLLAPDSTPSHANISDELNDILAKEKLTGLAWTLVFPERVETGATGYADGKLKRPFSANSKFHVGSITKSVLATGVLRLATLNQIGLDAPLSQYLPHVNFENKWAQSDPVTVRHLLDHTSGLEDARLWQMFSERAKADTPLAETLPQHALRVRTKPGSQFSYSNTGYGLLGMLIETVTNERYETFLNRELLLPLGMTNSSFAFTTQTETSADTSLAWGHVDDGSRYPAQPIFLRPAGQFTTTTKDMGAFTQFLLGGGTRPNGQPYISPALAAARGKAEGTLASEHGLIAGYALGLHTRDRHGVVGYCHGGNIVGFSARVCIFPEVGRAYAYSVNTDSETADYTKIDATLIEALSLDPTTIPASEPLPIDIDKWLGWYRLSPNRFETFVYIDMLFSATNLTQQDGQLALTPVQGEPRALRHTGDHLFSASDRSTTSHVLMLEENRGPTISDGFNTYERQSLVEVIWHWSVLSAGLAGLFYLFVSGLLLVIRVRREAFSHAIMPSFVGITTLFVPIPLFMMQSFMALGDATVASILLAIVSGLLPITISISLFKLVASKQSGWMQASQKVASLCALIWCLEMLYFGQLPIILWQ